MVAHIGPIAVNFSSPVTITVHAEDDTGGTHTELYGIANRFTVAQNVKFRGRSFRTSCVAFLVLHIRTAVQRQDSKKQENAIIYILDFHIFYA